MGDFVWKDWVPLGAALIAAAALLISGDLLSVTARLRRKLDKELSIMDRLPPGPARRDIARLCRWRALHLAYIELYEGKKRWRALFDNTFNVTFAVVYLAAVFREGRNPEFPSTAFVVGAILLLVLTAISVRQAWSSGIRRRRYVARWLDTAYQPPVRRRPRATPKVVTTARLPRRSTQTD